MAYTTKKSMLEAIRNGDEVSWKEFYDTYRPLIIFCGRNARLSGTETDDLIQIVMLKVFSARKTFRYDRSKGRFRDYLGHIIRNALIDLARSGKTAQAAKEELSQDPDGGMADSFTGKWNDEWKKHILSQAIELLRSKVEETTFQAFELAALDGRPPKEVAGFLNISVQNVYNARSRCMEILRKTISRLTEETEP